MKLTKTAKTQKTSQSFAGLFHRRLREGVLLLVGAGCLFLLLAILSHDPTDPFWFEAQKNASILNMGGRAGAFLSGALLFLFGYLSYLFPLMLFYGAWLYVKSLREIDQDYLNYFRLLRLAGFIFILLPGCALFHIHFPMLDSVHHVGAGGVIGKIIALPMIRLFNWTGANLIFTTLFLIGITLFTGFSWLKAADFLGEQVWRFSSYLQTLLTRVDQWALNSTEQEISLDIKKLKPDLPLNSDFNAIKNDPSSYESNKKNKSRRIEPTLAALADYSTISDPHEPFISKNSVLTTQPVFDSLKDSIHSDRASSESLSDSTQQKVDKTTSSAFTKNRKTSNSLEFLNSPNELPSLTLLDEPEQKRITGYTHHQLEEISKEVELRLQDFGIQAKVAAVHPGPVVTRFELQLAPGTKVSRISALNKDLARSLSAVSVRVVEVIPGKSVIGLEIPNVDRAIVRLKEIIESDRYQSASSPLSIALGKDISGNPVIVDLAKMPHLLAAGTTGSGKSVGLNAMLLSFLYKASPEDLRMILIDPKMLELSIYDGIPHLLTPVVTDMKDAANALRWAVAEMDRRYRLMAALGVRNLLGYNAKIKEALDKKEPLLDPLWVATHPDDHPVYLEKLPFIVVLVDEFADMMMLVGKKVEELIARIAQKARAAGIHLILATQRPSVDVITGLIKANIPTRIAFQVSSKIDSRTILDQQGAEQLLGHGDMLYLPPGTGVPIRIHGAFVSDDEVHRVVRALKKSGHPQYLSEILQGDSAETQHSFEGSSSQESESSGEQDPLYDQAVQIVLDTRRASISNIQRRLRIGYNRAANIVEAMEIAGIVSTMDNNGSREVLMPPLEQQ